MLSGKRIILGITGGIAAYKAAILLRALQKAGAEVRVTMTPAATRFVGVDTFASLSQHEVAVDIFPEGEATPDAWTRHINWGEWGDLFIIAPCTANTLAKIANGQADNMLTSTVLAARCPLLLCPTMDGEMFNAPATKQNLDTAELFGYHILEPEEGYLASGMEGKGRLPETEVIINKAKEILTKKKGEGPLAGKKVLVTAGPTREHIDPVRFISNPSSGKMGCAMAVAARELGGEVTLLHGPISINLPKQIQTEAFSDASTLFDLVQKHADADVIIMAAAVADFTPTQYHEQKIKKNSGMPSVELESTRDILQWLGDHKKSGQVLIGFAMETENLLENARQKRKKKKLDWIIANSLNEEGTGFATDTNKIQLIGKEQAYPMSGLKKELARKILRTIF